MNIPNKKRKIYLWLEKSLRKITNSRWFSLLILFFICFDNFLLLLIKKKYINNKFSFSCSKLIFYLLLIILVFLVLLLFVFLPHLLFNLILYWIFTLKMEGDHKTTIYIHLSKYNWKYLANYFKYYHLFANCISTKLK